MFMISSSLIPGLPDEVAVGCLVRLPFNIFSAARSVSKLWKQELDSPYFHTLRRSHGLTTTLVIFAQAELDRLATSGPAKKYARPTYRLTLYEPGTNMWNSLPPIPGLPNGLPLFCQIAAAERQLIVVGGWDSETWAVSDSVYIYHFAAGEWRVGTSMPGPRRSFFGAAAGSAGGGGVVVMVAGGHDEEKNALRSTLAYDVEGNKWTALPDMACERDECHGVYSSGKFYVIGGYSTEMQGRFSTSMEVFDLATLKWKMMKNDMVKCQSELSPRACVAGADGPVYMCAAGELVSVGDETWSSCFELPVEVREPRQAVGWGGSLMVIGSGGHCGQQTAYVLRLGEKESLWKMVELPEEYSGHIQAVCCVEI